MDCLISGKDQSTIDSYTFTFDGIAEEKLITTNKWSKESIYSTYTDYINQKIHEKKIDEGKLHFASNNDNTFKSPFNHGLLGTIINAYGKHIPLVLRPDDILIAIFMSFGKYVTKHPEEMRDCFVNHQGRKELSVKVSSPFMDYTTEHHWAEFVALMKEEMSNHVNNDLTEWFTPNFSTTTYLDDAISNVSLMASMKEYFSYKFVLGCGLSKVTLQGSIDDWVKLVDKSKHLYKFNDDVLSKWADLLVPVLEQFVQARRGIIDEEFWQRVCTSTSYGSGSQQTYHGWFVVFSPFNEGGKYLLREKSLVDEDHNYGNIDDDDIIDCHINVPIEVDDHGVKKYKCTFNAGMVMTRYDEPNNTLKPNIDWCLIINESIEI